MQELLSPCWLCSNLNGIRSSFRHKGLKRFYETGDGRGFRADLVPKLAVILHAIEHARRIDQVGKLPGWRVHPLKGGRRGGWSIVVTGIYRLTFHLDGEDVTEVDLEDYH